MKTHDYFKSRFGIRLEDTPVYSKDHGRASLLAKNNIGGVGIQAIHITDYPECLAIETRTRRKDHALKDYEYIKNNLERNYGTVIEAFFMGQITRRKRTAWIFYKIMEPDDRHNPFTLMQEIPHWEVPGLIQW